MHGERISVALCTFNGARFLREQLESIARQTHLPSELIVSDDASTDTTLPILRKFAETAPFPVRIFENERTCGVIQNFGQALERCSGDYIALCDQDDVWLPNKLEAFSAIFAKSPCANAAFSDALIIDESSQEVGSRVWERFGLGRREYKKIRKGRMVELLLSQTLVTGATLVISRQLRDRALPIPTTLPKLIIHDGWLTLLAAVEKSITADRKPLVLYRQHSNQQLGVLSAKKTSFVRFIDAIRATTNDRARRIEERKTFICETLCRATVLRSLLLERCGSGPWLRTWDAGLDHYEVRSHLPTGLISKCVGVLREICRGRYARYSPAPAAAVLRDLLYSGGKAKSVN